MESYFAKQPILSINNKTYAYELLYRHSPDTADYTGTDGDLSTADVINNVFFGGEPSDMIENCKAFVNFTERLLLDGVAKLLPKDILVVEVLETVSATGEIIFAVNELKKLGYMIALDDYIYTNQTALLFPFADIVKIDFRVSKEDIENTAKHCRECGKIILAEKVETLAEVEYAKSLGATLMQGYYFAKPLMMTQNIQSPMIQTFLDLVALFEKSTAEADVDAIERTISGDAAMTLKLLRLVNLMRNDTTEPIKSVNHAIVMLGMNKMKEWVYLFGMQNLTKNSPPELMRITLFRANFCEGLCTLLPHAGEYEKEMYLMGLMSLVAGGKAIDKLPVSDNIKNGLKNAGGVFSDVFNCVCAYENADWKAVDIFRNRYGIPELQFSKKLNESLSATAEIFQHINNTV